MPSFSGLSTDERSYLRHWQAAARGAGIDGVEDLASRPWPYPVKGVVIGVFGEGSEAAQWLVIGQHGSWAVADCADATVSQSFSSLRAALATIYQA